MRKTLFVLAILFLFLVGCSFSGGSKNEGINQPVNNQADSQEVSDDSVKLDADNDGLTDEQEKQYGTDSQKSDTDGDNYSDKKEIDSGHDPLVAYQPESLTVENKPATVAQETEIKPDEECSLRGEKLENCEVYTCYYTHPFTKTKEKVEILGYIAGKCLYKEEMPGGIMMECKYNTALRKEVAQFYRDNAVPKEWESITLELKTNDRVNLEGKSYTDGEETSNNILTKAINNGQCVIIMPSNE
ncbi:MAG: hypothetical protein WCT37_00840 [Patescibacteria group bacterium]